MCWNFAVCFIVCHAFVSVIRPTRCDVAYFGDLISVTVLFSYTTASLVLLIIDVRNTTDLHFELALVPGIGFCRSMDIGILTLVLAPDTCLRILSC